MTEYEAQQAYDDMLNEMFPLDGICCNSFATLLLEGDPTAYHCGFTDYCDAQEIELED